MVAEANSGSGGLRCSSLTEKYGRLDTFGRTDVDLKKYWVSSDLTLHEKTWKAAFFALFGHDALCLYLGLQEGVTLRRDDIKSTILGLGKDKDVTQYSLMDSSRFNPFLISNIKKIYEFCIPNHEPSQIQAARQLFESFKHLDWISEPRRTNSEISNPFVKIFYQV